MFGKNRIYTAIIVIKTFSSNMIFMPNKEELFNSIIKQFLLQVDGFYRKQLTEGKLCNKDG